MKQYVYCTWVVAGLRQLNSHLEQQTSHTYSAAGAVEVRALSRVYFDRIELTPNADPSPTKATKGKCDAYIDTVTHSHGSTVSGALIKVLNFSLKD